MQNGILFLHIHEGVQASQKYGKPDEYKCTKPQYDGGNREPKNTENLMSKSLENNIKAATTRSKNTEDLTSTI